MCTTSLTHEKITPVLTLSLYVDAQVYPQLEQLYAQLSEKDQQVTAVANSNDRLQEEVLSTTQQVKQYKKQVDQYKEEVGANRRSAEMRMKQVQYMYSTINNRT